MFLIIFILGLCIGSFLNVIIYRLPKDEKVFGRSYCPNCRKKIAWYDLIPVFSFCCLLGKCRFCGQKISWQYPLVEISTGILFLLTTYNLQLATYNLQNLIQLAYWLLVVSCLVVVFVIDLKHYIIPDVIIFLAIGTTIFYQIIFNSQFYHSILSAFGAAVFFLIIFLISRGKWMGLGDAKLAGLLGFFLGWPDILVALFAAFLLGAIMGLGLVGFGKKGFKSEIPFGPFLVSGAFLSMFWGEQLIGWYLKSII